MRRIVVRTFFEHLTKNGKVTQFLKKSKFQGKNYSTVERSQDFFQEGGGGGKIRGYL